MIKDVLDMHVGMWALQSTLWRREGMNTLCAKKCTSAALLAYSGSLLIRFCTETRPSCTAGRFMSMPTDLPILPTWNSPGKNCQHWSCLQYLHIPI